jgi:hypothetical protein
MAVITKVVAEGRLQAYIDAELKILGRERYKIEDRELQSASLASIREGITFWEAKAIAAGRSGADHRIRLGVPNP